MSKSPIGWMFLMFRIFKVLNRISWVLFCVFVCVCVCVCQFVYCVFNQHGKSGQVAPPGKKTYARQTHDNCGLESASDIGKWCKWMKGERKLNFPKMVPLIMRDWKI